MNGIGWTIVAAGAVGVLASIAGILIELTNSAADLALHDTYYVVIRPRWALILCVVLSAAICIVGYMQTTHCLRRLLPDHSSPIWRSPSNDAQ